MGKLVSPDRLHSAQKKYDTSPTWYSSFSSFENLLGPDSLLPGCLYRHLSTHQTVRAPLAVPFRAGRGGGLEDGPRRQTAAVAYVKGGVGAPR